METARGQQEQMAARPRTRLPSLVSPFLHPAPRPPHPAPGTSLCQRPPQCSPGAPGALGWPGPAGARPPALVGHQHLWAAGESKAGCRAFAARPTLWGPLFPPVEWGVGAKATQCAADTSGCPALRWGTWPQQLGPVGGEATEPGHTGALRDASTSIPSPDPKPGLAGRGRPLLGRLRFRQGFQDITQLSCPAGT